MLGYIKFNWVSEQEENTKSANKILPVSCLAPRTDLQIDKECIATNCEAHGKLSGISMHI